MLEKNNEIGGFNTSQKLHTDVLEALYGIISAKVIRHDGPESFIPGNDRIRVARLVDGDDICRTFAITFLTYDKCNQLLLKIDSNIKQGGSIGKVFRKFGYEVKKNVLDVFIADVPQHLQEDLRTNTDEYNNKAKVRLSEFYAKVGNNTPVIYGYVIEIYPPDFKEATVTEYDKDQINPTTGTLLDSGIPVDEVRNRLDRAGEKDERVDYGETYTKAQNWSKPIVDDIRGRFLTYLLRSYS